MITYLAYSKTAGGLGELNTSIITTTTTQHDDEQTMKKLGIIQSRGLGDIFIAIPIAKYLSKEYQILWPTLAEWCPHLEKTVPWIKWIPIEPDSGPYFYDIPLQRLRNFGCDEILPLYNALTGHPEFSGELQFQHSKFDEYKYIKAQVPFLEKWNLAQSITRDLDKEQDLYDKLVQNPEYVVVHLEGSDSRADFDRSIIPETWQIIEITGKQHWVTDYLTILERAQSVILVDSVYANLVDQLGICDDRYFIARSHIQLTPTLGREWTWLPNLNLNPRTRIFQPG